MTQDRGAAGREPAGDETLAEAFWAVARQLRDTSQETLAPWDINPLSCGPCACSGATG